MAWDRGDTRIAYVVKVVRYAGRAVTQTGGRRLVGFYRGQSAPTLIAGMTKALQSGGLKCGFMPCFCHSRSFFAQMPQGFEDKSNYGRSKRQ